MKKREDLRIPFKWEERRPVFLGKFLYIPNYYLHHEEWPIVPWSDPAFFGRKGPVAIEYCSGNGQWIAERAKRFPETLWVAVEKRFDRARKIWGRGQREQLENLFVICGEAHLFTCHYVAPESVEEIYINFPDPWPKRHHAKHRLIQEKFLEELCRVVRKGGKLTFVTDDLAYREIAMKELALCSNWQSEFPEPGYTTVWPDYGPSWFHELWLGKGRTIHYLRYTHV